MTEEVEISKSWKVAKLEEVCEITSSKRIFQHDYVSEGIPFYRTKEVKELSEGKEVSIELFITNDKYANINKQFGVPRVGDILVSAVRTIGVSYIVQDDRPFYFKDGNLVWIKNLQGLSAKFLHYYIAHFIRFKQSIATSGSAYNALTIVKLKDFEIPLPNIDEQQQIVLKIEELFSEIDKGIEEIKTAQQQLKIYRQAVLKSAFEGKLTNDAVQDGELPKGWKNATIGDVCSSVEYGSATKSKASGKVPVLRMGNIQNGRFEWDDLVYTDDDDEINKYLLKKNDVLFNRTNSAELVGKTAIYKGERPAIFAGYLIRINRIEELVDANYLTYYLNSKRARSYGNTVRSFGVNQSNINGTKLKTYPLPLPSLEEQQQIVQEIESRLSVCDKIEETITNSLKQAEALRQSILKKAFEGKLS